MLMTRLLYEELIVFNLKLD